MVERTRCVRGEPTEYDTRMSERILGKAESNNLISDSSGVARVE